jgi:hypothetical protein
MSYDVFVQDLPRGIRSVDEILDDFMPQPPGPRARIAAAVQHVAPTARLTDPAWLGIDGSDYSIEVTLGEADPVEGFAFHIRAGDKALFVVAEILEMLGLRARARGGVRALHRGHDRARLCGPACGSGERTQAS